MCVAKITFGLWKMENGICTGHTSHRAMVIMATANGIMVRLVGQSGVT